MVDWAGLYNLLECAGMGLGAGLVMVLGGCSSQATALTKAYKDGLRVCHAGLGCSACWHMRARSGDQLSRGS